jgi:hypothetical protein
MGELDPEPRIAPASTGREDAFKRRLVGIRVQPETAGVIRPSGATAVISTIITPAPDNDSEPKCCRCQSFAEPSTALYWHIGDTAMRLARVRPPMVIGENRCNDIRNSTAGLRG